MKKRLRSMKTLVAGAFYRVVMPRFYQLKAQANGMLAPSVYRHLYRQVYELPDLDIVEIGGGAGAGSVAIAWAMQESAKASKVIVVEKLEGGSRSDHGSVSENLALIHQNFERFKVVDQIVLYPHEITVESGQEVLGLITTDRIAALVHDADGRIDRDFELFWPRLMPGGLIMVDDYRDSRVFRPISERYPHGGIKKLLTYRLLNQFIQWGLFELRAVHGCTAFGRKPANAHFSAFDREICTAIMQEVWGEREACLKSV